MRSEHICYTAKGKKNHFSDSFNVSSEQIKINIAHVLHIKCRRFDFNVISIKQKCQKYKEQKLATE